MDEFYDLSESFLEPSRTLKKGRSHRVRQRRHADFKRAPYARPSAVGGGVGGGRYFILRSTKYEVPGTKNEVPSRSTFSSSKTAPIGQRVGCGNDESQLVFHEYHKSQRTKVIISASGSVQKGPLEEGFPVYPLSPPPTTDR